MTQLMRKRAPCWQAYKRLWRVYNLCLKVAASPVRTTSSVSCWSINCSLFESANALARSGEQCPARPPALIVTATQTALSAVPMNDLVTERVMIPSSPRLSAAKGHVVVGILPLNLQRLSGDVLPAGQLHQASDWRLLEQVLIRRIRLFGQGRSTAPPSGTCADPAHRSVRALR